MQNCSFSNITNQLQEYTMSFMDTKSLIKMRLVDKRTSSNATKVLLRKVEKNEVKMSPIFLSRLICSKIDISYEQCKAIMFFVTTEDGRFFASSPKFFESELGNLNFAKCTLFWTYTPDENKLSKENPNLFFNTLECLLDKHPHMLDTLTYTSNNYLYNTRHLAVMEQIKGKISNPQNLPDLDEYFADRISVFETGEFVILPSEVKCPFKDPTIKIYKDMQNHFAKIPNVLLQHMMLFLDMRLLMKMRLVDKRTSSNVTKVLLRKVEKGEVDIRSTFVSKLIKPKIIKNLPKIYEHAWLFISMDEDKLLTGDVNSFKGNLYSWFYGQKNVLGNIRSLKCTVFWSKTRSNIYHFLIPLEDYFKKHPHLLPMPVGAIDFKTWSSSVPEVYKKELPDYSDWYDYKIIGFEISPSEFKCPLTDPTIPTIPSIKKTTLCSKIISCVAPFFSYATSYFK